MADSIQLRPRSEADAPFLATQFNAQTIHYDQYYGEADKLIVEKDGVPIGRLYVDRAPNEIEIIDIALLPQFRGGGLGTRLLRDILREGEESGRPVRIYVEHFNPARHLYDRLGFQHIDTNGVYHLMKWTPNAV
jgi:ribosomal protein S18 acetylase RimI-like enzyme